MRGKKRVKSESIRYYKREREELVLKVWEGKKRVKSESIRYYKREREELVLKVWEGEKESKEWEHKILQKGKRGINIKSIKRETRE